MRIVAGVWADQPLVSPGGRVRPTAQDVRVAIMELLARDLHGASVADLFAGTGALGLEALSRGARRCDFVENGPAALHALKANVASLRAKARARIFVKDAIPFAERLAPGAYDIVFADPPYGSGKLDRIVEQWLLVPFSTVLVLEHSPEHELAVRRGGDSAAERSRQEVARPEQPAPVRRSGDSAAERSRPEAARPEQAAPVAVTRRRVRDSAVTVLRRADP